jgi:uncharacterized membrane protein YdbT with pleckstrin-like domain
MSSHKQGIHGEVVWIGKPWTVPAAIIRTITVFGVLAIFVWLEIYASVAFSHLAFLQIFAWTILIFVVIWLLSLLDLLIFRASHTYILRQDGLEIRNGLLRLHSFVVSDAAFGDLLVYQSIGGRIFGYGEITVNSQGERETKLILVRAPFETADKIRDVMGKPIVRVEDHA